MNYLEQFNRLYEELKAARAQGLPIPGEEEEDAPQEVAGATKGRPGTPQCRGTAVAGATREPRPCSPGEPAGQRAQPQTREEIPLDGLFIRAGREIVATGECSGPFCEGECSCGECLCGDLECVCEAGADVGEHPWYYDQDRAEPGTPCRYCGKPAALVSRYRNALCERCWVIASRGAGLLSIQVMNYQPRPFGPIPGDDDYEEEAEEAEPDFPDPWPHLSGVCHVCGAEVECYDEQGVAWCMKCSPPRPPYRPDLGQ